MPNEFRLVDPQASNWLLAGYGGFYLRCHCFSCVSYYRPVIGGLSHLRGRKNEVRRDIEEISRELTNAIAEFHFHWASNIASILLHHEKVNWGGVFVKHKVPRAQASRNDL